MKWGKGGLLWPRPFSWCWVAEMSWCTFAVHAFFFCSSFALIEANQFLFSYTPPFFPPIFFTCFQKPVTHRDTSHVPHFQDLASTWEYIQPALHQLFPPVPSLCVVIVCLFPAKPREMLCYPVSLFIPLSFKSKAFMLCLSLFWTSEEVFLLLFWSNNNVYFIPI